MFQRLNGMNSNDLLASSSSDPRRQGPLYVEARGYLQPSVDFYNRAVQSADRLEVTSGELLSEVISHFSQYVHSFLI